MATAIAVYNSEGCVGRCDANCHDAASDAGTCDCICGGKNHGGGLQKAIDNNHQRFGLEPADLEKFAKAHGLDPTKLVVADRLKVKNTNRARKQAAAELRRRDYATRYPDETA